MRGKIAKRLRKQAREMTEGSPEVVYIRKFKKDNFTKSFVILHAECTRSIYQNLKKEYKRDKSAC